VQLVSNISNLCDPDPPTLQTDRQTDGQTDGRHTISIPRYALVHRAVKTDPCIQYSFIQKCFTRLTAPIIVKIPDFGPFISLDGMNSVFSFNKYNFFSVLAAVLPEKNSAFARKIMALPDSPATTVCTPMPPRPVAAQLNKHCVTRSTRQ